MGLAGTRRPPSDCQTLTVVSNQQRPRLAPRRIVIIISMMLAAGLGSVCAGEAQPGQAAPLGGPVSDGPPPPLAPATVSRDGAGRAIVRAIRLDQPLQVDGRLDESVYEQMQPAADF